MPSTATAAAATKLVVIAPIIVCPISPCFVTQVESGRPFLVEVAAVDDAGIADIGYVGTVTFTSTDPLASLPSGYTFVSGDRGIRYFENVVLVTNGVRTITVTDSANNLVGTLTLTVLAASSSIPVISGAAESVFVLALLLAGCWLLRSRG